MQFQIFNFFMNINICSAVQNWQLIFLFILLQANGELYYFASMIAFGIVTYVSPQLWVSVYDNFGPILGGLNVLALALCLYLLVQAKMKDTEDDPYLVNNVR